MDSKAGSRDSVVARGAIVVALAWSLAIGAAAPVAAIASTPETSETTTTVEVVKVSSEAEAAARKARAAKAARLRARRARAAALRRIKWRVAKVSWYGPGFYGHGMAGGGKLKRTSMVVAHRRLPFGTKVQFRYHGRIVVATVKDRGPFIRGREFDLGPGIAKRLKFRGVGRVRYRIIRRA